MRTMKNFHAELQPSQKPQKSEARSQKKPKATRSQKPEARSQKPEAKASQKKEKMPKKYLSENSLTNQICIVNTENVSQNLQWKKKIFQNVKCVQNVDKIHWNTWRMHMYIYICIYMYRMVTCVYKYIYIFGKI